MGTVIIPTQHKADGNSFAGMLGNRTFDEASRDFVRILASSFRADRERNGADYEARIHTQTEERRRADILGRWFRELRGAGFSYARTMDELPKALRAELDGGCYTPPERHRLWTPGEC